MSAFFEVERIFFEKYINDLSSDAFKVLLKMLYLAKTSDNDVSIRSNRSLRRIIGVNIAYADSIWNELVTNELVIKKERKKKTIFILNSKKIRSDNQQFVESIGEIRNLQVTILGIEEQTEVIDINIISEDTVARKVKQMFESTEPALLTEITKTANLLRQYHIDREKTFKFSDLGKFLLGLVSLDSNIIQETCYRYNNDARIAGMRGFRYVLKMAQGIKSDKESTKNKNVTNIKGKEEVEERTREGEKKFAIKVATGKAEDSMIYKRLLKDDINKLKSIWQDGVDLLSADNRDDEIFNKYDWLKS